MTLGLPIFLGIIVSTKLAIFEGLQSHIDFAYTEYQSLTDQSILLYNTYILTDGKAKDIYENKTI